MSSGQPNAQRSDPEVVLGYAEVPARPWLGAIFFTPSTAPKRTFPHQRRHARIATGTDLTVDWPACVFDVQIPRRRHPKSPPKEPSGSTPPTMSNASSRYFRGNGAASRRRQHKRITALRRTRGKWPPSSRSPPGSTPSPPFVARCAGSPRLPASGARTGVAVRSRRSRQPAPNRRAGARNDSFCSRPTSTDFGRPRLSMSKSPAGPGEYGSDVANS